MFPIKYHIEFDDDYYDATEEEKEQKWNDFIAKFWLGVSEPIRQLFVAAYNDEVAPRFEDTDRISADASTRVVSIDTLKWIIELPYEYFREKLANRILRDNEPSLCEQIFEIYIGKRKRFERQFGKSIILYIVRRPALKITQNCSLISFSRYHPVTTMTKDFLDH